LKRGGRADAQDSPRKTGLAETILRATTLDGEVWEARFGYVVAKKNSDQHGVMYDTLVNTVRAQIPPEAGTIHAKASAISNSPERQKIVLSNGEAISARLGALGRVHDLLLRTSWAGAMLPELLKTAIEPFETPGREQFRIQPTPIRINPAAALPFVMTINELCTNASKHGALTVPNGRVNIATKVSERGGTFHFKWSEKGGPLVGEPSRRSFGMFLIERGFAQQFSGSTRMRFKPSGVVCEIDVPLAAIQQQVSN